MWPKDDVQSAFVWDRVSLSKFTGTRWNGDQPDTGETTERKRKTSRNTYLYVKENAPYQDWGSYCRWDRSEQSSYPGRNERDRWDEFVEFVSDFWLCMVPIWYFNSPSVLCSAALQCTINHIILTIPHVSVLPGTFMEAVLWAVNSIPLCVSCFIHLVLLLQITSFI